jgi:hypothetical protein
VKEDPQRIEGFVSSWEEVITATRSGSNCRNQGWIKRDRKKYTNRWIRKNRKEKPSINQTKKNKSANGEPN